jgi:hypothetical protein
MEAVKVVISIAVISAGAGDTTFHVMRLGANIDTVRMHLNQGSSNNFCNLQTFVNQRR